MRLGIPHLLFGLLVLLGTGNACAATSIPFTVTMSEAVNVTGAPRIVLDVGGATRYATYAAGTGTASLTFTYAATAGDVDLDGIGIASTTLDLNGGAVTDLNGNPETNLTFTAPANMSSVFINYPSLSMDFTADSDGRYSLSGTVYNDLTSFLAASGGTFSRASVGTYFDSAGTLQTAASGAPRFDYHPTTHAANGLLIEESRTNLFTYSSQLDQASWNTRAGSTTIATASSAPDGSATTYLETKSSGDGYVWKSYNFPVSTAYTLSLFVKGGGSASTITFHYWDGTTQQNSAAIPISAGQAWTRVSFSFTTSASVSPPGDVGFYIGANPFYVWGAQLEQGAFATSFIATTNAAVTRAADVFTLPTGSWYNSLESTVFAQYQVPYPTSGQHGVFSLNDGTLSNKTDLRANGQMITSLAGASQENQIVAVNIGSTNKISKGIILNNFSGSSNGSAVVTDNSVNVPSVNKLQIGGLDNSPTYGLDGTVERLKYYPQRIDNTQLQLMTQ